MTVDWENGDFLIGLWPIKQFMLVVLAGPPLLVVSAVVVVAHVPPAPDVTAFLSGQHLRNWPQWLTQKLQKNTKTVIWTK